MAMLRLRRAFSSGETSLRRAIIAFIVAPPLASFVFAALWAASVSFHDSAGIGETLLKIILWALLATVLAGAPVAYIGMGAVGLPTWILLRFTRREATLTYMVAGAAGGALLAQVIPIAPLFGDRPAANGAAAGATLMLAFWVIAHRRID
jgi:hypothetical protein